MNTPEFPDRFWLKVDTEGSLPEYDDTLGPCWIWLGAISRDGYGRAKGGDGKIWLAHRIAYTECVGPIPQGLFLDHLCRVRCCVNPAHLEPVTNAENQRRAVGARTTCRRGHEYTPENTMRTKTGRDCRECNRQRQRDRYRRRKVAVDNLRTAEAQQDAPSLFDEEVPA